MTEYLIIAVAMEEVDGGERVWEYFEEAVDVFWDTLVEDSQDPVLESEELGGNAWEADAVVSTGNTRISVFEDDDGDPCYKVLGKSKWAKNTKWLDQIVEFLNDLQNSVSKYIPNGQIMVYTDKSFHF